VFGTQLSAALESDGIKVEAGRVSGWGDTRFGAITLRQPEAQLRPGYTADEANGYPCVEFGDSAAFPLWADNAPNWADTSFTVFIVAQFGFLENGKRRSIVSTGAAGSFELCITCDQNVGIANEINRGGCNAGAVCGSNLMPNNYTWYVVTFRSAKGIESNGRSDVQVWLNGVAADSTLVLQAALQGSYLMAGASNMASPGSSMDGDMAALIIYNSALDENGRLFVEHYLVQKLKLTGYKGQ
jgi:hypothetical protein